MIVNPQVLADLPSKTLDAMKKHHSHAPKPSDPTLPIPGPVPDIVYDYATKTGHQTLWVVFVIMLLATIAFSALSWKVAVGKRLYHVITTLVVTFAALSYFAMASGDGKSINHIVVTHHHTRTDPTYTDVYREVYWARYVDWALTTPLLLLDLSLLAGLNGASITTAIVADVIMVLTGLFAAFGDENTAQKWGWYAIACVAYLVIVWQLAFNGRVSAVAKGGKVGGFYTAIAGFTLILWTAYPIVWGVADGARIASPDAEIIAYAVLDVLAKPVFGLWLLLTHSNLPETNIDVGGFWAHGLSSEGTIRVGDDADGA